MKRMENKGGEFFSVRCGILLSGGMVIGCMLIGRMEGHAVFPRMCDATAIA